MEMSEQEILSNYRQAKNKSAQIGILAELNICEKKMIIEILERHGIKVGGTKMAGRKKNIEIKEVNEVVKAVEEKVESAIVNEIPEAVQQVEKVPESIKEILEEHRESLENRAISLQRSIDDFSKNLMEVKNAVKEITEFLERAE